MAAFQIPRDRDAYFVIRGFRYQIDLSILRWLKLAENEHLELECGEDIDIVSTALANPSREIARQLQQVKRIDKGITLRSESVKVALANAVDHLSKSPEFPLTIRFCTNAPASVERPSPFADRMPAILVWEGLRQRSYSEAQIPQLLEGIQKLLKAGSRPPDFDEEVWTAFKRFLFQSDETKLLWLVDRVEWSTATPDVEPLQTIIRASLVGSGFSPHRQHASELHARLFLHVMSILSQSDRKILRSGDLLELAKLPTLQQQEQALLNFVSTEVFRLEARVDALESSVEQNAAALTAIQVEINRRASAEGVAAELTQRLPELSLDPPPLVNLLCARQITVKSLVDGALRRTWTAIHGSIGTGKTQLALLAAKLLGGSTVYFSLRDLDSTQSVMRLLAGISRLSNSKNLLLTPSQLGTAIGGLPPGSQLLVDDLPRPDGQDQLSQLLMSLARICSQRDILLISTSHYPLPAAIYERMNPDTVESVPVPPCNAAEARELFEIHGAPKAFLDPRIVDTINAFTQGHPTLLVAYARSLATSEWKLDRQELKRLSCREHTETAVDNAVHRLLSTVKDAEAREVLCRLSLVLGEFGSQEVQVAASVAPPVTHPRECLARLTGLWIEERADRQMAVSPLVKPLGSTELTGPVRKEVYRSLANLIVSGRTISIFDVGKAAFYLEESGDYNRLGLFLAMALISARELPSHHLELLYFAARVEGQLPQDMDLGIRILLRGQQIQLVDRLGRPLDRLIADLDDLMSNARQEHEWAVFLSALTTSWIVGKTSFDTALRFCRRAIELQARVARLLNRIPVKGDGQSESIARIPLAEYIWLSALGVSDANDLLTWIRFLDHFPDEFLTDVFSCDSAEMGSIVLVDRPWLTEHAKPLEERDWGPITVALEQVATFAECRSIERLWAGAVRALIAINGEYLDDLESATRIATAALQHPLVSDESRFLINDIIGRQFVYKKRFREAQHWLNVALKVKTDHFPSIRFRTLLETSRAVGDDYPQLAVNYCTMAVELARSNPIHIAALEMPAALAELGLAEWLSSGNLGSVFVSFNEAARTLLQCKDGSDLWKQRYAAFAHVAAYFGSLAAVGAPPPHTSDGEEYASPSRGNFMSPNAKLSEYYDEKNYELLGEALFCPVMAMFAEAVGQSEECAEWALRGMDEARNARSPGSISLLGQYVFPVLLNQGRIREAIDATFESCTAMVAAKISRQSADSDAITGVNISEVLGSMPNDNWVLAEVWTADRGVIPAVMQIWRVALADSNEANRLAKELISTCEQIAEYASNPGLWNELGVMVASILVDPKSAAELHEISNEAANEGESTLHRLGYLGCTLVPGAPIERAAVYHAVIFENLHSTVGERSPTYSKIAIPFLTEFWHQRFAQQRFRFSAPHIVERALSDAADASIDSRAQMVLKAALDGFRTRLPSRLSVVSEWLTRS